MLISYLTYEILYSLTLLLYWMVCMQWLPAGRTPLYGQYGNVPLDRALSEYRT